MSLEESDSFFHFCDLNKNEIDVMTFVGAKSKTEWYWIATGKNVTFNLKFEFDQPDNTYDDEMCLALGHFNETFYFNDISCSVLHSNICQTKDYHY